MLYLFLGHVSLLASFALREDEGRVMDKVGVIYL
jgi:hypothetical protein